MYENQWLAKINRTSDNGKDGNKLRTYCTFKTKYALENYLLTCDSKFERSAFAKLRISGHRLRIETGRHVRPKIDPDKRYCIHCNDLSIEDERHFILKCKLYTEERNDFFLELKKILPDVCLLNSESLFKVILNCYQGDTEVCKIVTKHVKQCMDKKGNS
jgi:hypothetical protein